MVFALTGCFYIDTTTVVDTSDNIKMTSKMGFTKASVDAAGSEYAEMVKDMKLETINGTEYYTETQTASTTVSAGAASACAVGWGIGLSPTAIFGIGVNF